MEDQQGRRNHRKLMVWGLSVKDLPGHPKAVTLGAYTLREPSVGGNGKQTPEDQEAWLSQKAPEMTQKRESEGVK